MKRRIALLAATVALLIPAGVSAAPPAPQYGEPNCAGLYRAYLIDAVEAATPGHGGGLKAVADYFGFASVKDLQAAIEAACG